MSKLAIEPKDVDLVVEPHKYTEDDKNLMSRIIEHYKQTGELLKLEGNLKKSKNRKEAITKP
ncbi:MAG: hypothetical protein WAT92_12690 [Saprospiraceae bacterium]